MYIKTKFIKPYLKAGKTNLLFCVGRAGVYIIKDWYGVIVYIGYSGGDLYKTLTRHFQKWPDLKQRRVTYSQNDGHTIRVVLTSPKRAAALEITLRLKYKPKDNPMDPPEITSPANDWTKAKMTKYIDEYNQAPVTDLENAPF